MSKKQLINNAWRRVENSLIIMRYKPTDDNTRTLTKLWFQYAPGFGNMYSAVIGSSMIYKGEKVYKTFMNFRIATLSQLENVKNAIKDYFIKSISEGYIQIGEERVTDINIEDIQPLMPGFNKNDSHTLVDKDGNIFKHYDDVVKRVRENRPAWEA